ncbi:MAG TPA: alpha/beta hydrolase [Phototrophicaceae bacterium]|nr:alpha/beta hydrolase [Phototrophicaceae bacterium]
MQRVPVYEFGGSGTVLNFAVANGFPPETYLPLLQPLTDDYRVISLLPRALWDQMPPPDGQLNWRDGVMRDLLAGFHDHQLQDVIAIGHSFGGIASLLAVIEEPERFKALILLDPTILTPDFFQMLDALRENDMMDQMPLAARAIKRQRHFANHEAAFDYFKGRGIFTDWSDEAVRLYIDQGTRPSEYGITLRWSPEWEAYYFKTGYTRIWDDLPRLRGLVPTLIIRGGKSDTYLTESSEKVKAILPEATHIEIPGHGHLFPQTAPVETLQIIQDWLKNIN